MFDTHCHLNFSRFKKNVDEVIENAKQAGIVGIVVPGTDIPTSKKAIEVAERYEWIWAAVGIHPHHVYEFFEESSMSHFSLKWGPRATPDSQDVKNEHSHFLMRVNAMMQELETLLENPKIVAIGECGLDRHEYKDTKYGEYQVDEKFMKLQIEILEKQIDLAKKYKKSLILHNREAKQDMLPILEKKWDPFFEGRAVFHCCEPDQELLKFAKDHKMYIGVDGDITYFKEKQEFIKQVPLEMLVLETDAPFLLPEPLRTEKKYPNEPKNIPVFVKLISEICEIPIDQIQETTTANAKKLFALTK